MGEVSKLDFGKSFLCVFFLLFKLKQNFGIALKSLFLYPFSVTSVFRLYFLLCRSTIQISGPRPLALVFLQLPAKLS